MSAAGASVQSAGEASHFHIGVDLMIRGLDV
jgi:hypothetical protein